MLAIVAVLVTRGKADHRLIRMNDKSVKIFIERISGARSISLSREIEKCSANVGQAFVPPRHFTMFECEEKHVYFLAAVGVTFSVLFAIYLLNIIVKAIKLFVVSRCFPPNIKKYGEWAIVTGSTDGIGKSYARELAQRGLSIVLVSRNIQKLRNTARELEEEFDVNVDIIQADFTKGWEICERIKNDLMNKEVGVLINNVGLMAPLPCYFLSLSHRDILDIIHVNITSVVLMTHVVLPEMLKRGTGAIVTMSSLLSLFITPLVSCYGAAKAVSNSFGIALSHEKFPGIVFQTLVLSCVNTKLVDYSRIWKWNPFITNPDSYVRSAIKTLGYAKHTTGYFGHSVQLFMKIFPETITKYLMYWTNLIMYRKQIARIRPETY